MISSLTSIDYTVFILLLVVSLGIGVIIGYKDRKQSANSFLLYDGAMNPYAAGMSIFVSYISALTIIGFPVEVYLFGNSIFWRMLGGSIGLFVLDRLFLPKIYELK